MIRKEIEYRDLNGDLQKTTAYFNMMTPEVTRITMKFGIDGDLKEGVAQMIARGDGERMIEFLEETILTAYGRRVESGKQFLKSKKDREDFENSVAYAELFAAMLNNPNEMKEFTESLFADTSAQNGKTLVTD